METFQIYYRLIGNSTIQVTKVEADDVSGADREFDSVMDEGCVSEVVAIVPMGA